MTAEQIHEEPQRASRLIPQIRRTTTNGSIMYMEREGRLRDLPLIDIAFRIHPDHGPALRSAVDEISSLVGGRLVGSHRFAKEQSLTNAVIVLGALRAAVNALVPDSDPDYI